MTRDGHGEGKRREGVVIKVLKRGTETLVGTFMQSRSFGFVRPDDTHYGQDVFIPKKCCGAARNNDKVVVRLLSYVLKGRNRRERSRRSSEMPTTRPQISPRSSGRSESRTLSRERSCGKRGSMPDEVVFPKGENRTDYRDLLTVTIDGEDAKDLDDAITLRRCDGGYELGVHIADVSHYVREGSPLDKEALSRGTSVYLCDRVIPMLPRELSNGICSLNAGVDRLALSCVMQVDAKGNVTGHKIVESVIRVDKRMSYTGVKAILEGKDHPEGEREDIRGALFPHERGGGHSERKAKKTRRHRL